MTYMGWASLCLPTKDLEKSKAFYLSAGFELVSEVPEMRAVLASGNFRKASALGDLFEGRSMHFPFRSRDLHLLATRISRA